MEADLERQYISPEGGAENWFTLLLFSWSAMLYCRKLMERAYKNCIERKCVAADAVTFQ